LQLNVASSQLQSVQRTKDKLEIEHKLLTSHVAKLVHTAAQYFTTEFSCIDSVIARFEQMNLVITSPQTPIAADSLRS
jgi:hypothetical protein